MHLDGSSDEWEAAPVNVATEYVSIQWSEGNLIGAILLCSSKYLYVIV